MRLLFDKCLCMNQGIMTERDLFMVQVEHLSAVGEKTNN